MASPLLKIAILTVGLDTDPTPMYSGFGEFPFPDEKRAPNAMILLLALNGPPTMSELRPVLGV